MSSPRQSSSCPCDCDFNNAGCYKGEECVVFSDVEITEESAALKKGEVEDQFPTGCEGEKESRPDTYNIPVLETKPPNYMWLALCTTIFFNPLSGIVALVLAIQADAEYMRNSYEQARRLGRVVKLICIVSIVITVIVLVVISSFFVDPPFSSS